MNSKHILPDALLAATNCFAVKLGICKAHVSRYKMSYAVY